MNTKKAIALWVAILLTTIILCVFWLSRSSQPTNPTPAPTPARPTNMPAP